VEAFNYTFLALRGYQAGREYYTTMCPLKLIPKIFLFDEEEIPPELRAQRLLNKARIPEIARYIIDNPKDYIFSAITASIDGESTFEPLSSEGIGRDAGVLTVPMTSRILINDGQHRRAAIEEALKADPHLGDETISVVFFIDAGLERSQQMFADLNKHAIRPTRSIGILYDKRDPLANLSISLVDAVPIFKGLTEKEKTTISNRSTKLFTLSAVYQATEALLGLGQKETIEKQSRSLAKDYWTVLGEVVPEWRLAIKREVSPAELRKQFVHSHGVALHALGMVGNSLVEIYPEDWKDRLEPLSNVDWRRENAALWEGRAMVHGQMSKAGHSVRLTANALKSIIGLPLSAEDAEIENLITSHKRG